MARHPTRHSRGTTRHSSESGNPRAIGIKCVSYRGLDSLDSQTKCNTKLRCCHGSKIWHLSIEERCEVARLRTAGYSVRQIAASLDRSPSTISRELKRNGSRTQGYSRVMPDQQAHARRWRGSKLERNDSLGEQVLARLRQNWSPEQVAGRLALEAGRTVVSHETIYRFIYARIARKKDYSWRHYLPGAKSKRGWRGRKGGNPASFIQLRRPCPSVPRMPPDGMPPATGRRT